MSHIADRIRIQKDGSVTMAPDPSDTANAGGLSKSIGKSAYTAKTLMREFVAIATHCDEASAKPKLTQLMTDIGIPQSNHSVLINWVSRDWASSDRYRRCYVLTEWISGQMP